MSDSEKAIEVFERPSKHIRCIHECENGMQFLTYSQNLVKAFETAISALKFKAYFDELYGKGLEVANWHQNGDLEPFDSFYESACEE